MPGAGRKGKAAVWQLRARGRHSSVCFLTRLGVCIAQAQLAARKARKQQEQGGHVIQARTPASLAVSSAKNEAAGPGALPECNAQGAQEAQEDVGVGDEGITLEGPIGPYVGETVSASSKIREETTEEQGQQDEAGEEDEEDVGLEDGHVAGREVRGRDSEEGGEIEAAAENDVGKKRSKKRGKGRNASAGAQI